AEDGIRDRNVTGVQTCALPIFCQGDPINHTDPRGHMSWQAIAGIALGVAGILLAGFTAGSSIIAAGGIAAALNATTTTALVMGRSEERRVGKGGRGMGGSGE